MTPTDNVTYFNSCHICQVRGEAALTRRAGMCTAAWQQNVGHVANLWTKESASFISHCPGLHNRSAQ